MISTVMTASSSRYTVFKIISNTLRTHVENFDLLCCVLEDEIGVRRLRVEHREGELVEHLFQKPEVMPQEFK
jgi:hypothetical protein